MANFHFVTSFRKPPTCIWIFISSLHGNAVPHRDKDVSVTAFEPVDSKATWLGNFFSISVLLVLQHVLLQLGQIEKGKNFDEAAH